MNNVYISNFVFGAEINSRNINHVAAGVWWKRNEKICGVWLA